jgi:hypothetical protein
MEKCKICGRELQKMVVTTGTFLGLATLEKVTVAVKAMCPYCCEVKIQNFSTRLKQNDVDRPEGNKENGGNGEAA